MNMNLFVHSRENLYGRCALIALTLALCLNLQAARKKTAKKAVFPVSVTELKTERMVSPMSIDTPTPRLGWIITSQQKDGDKKDEKGKKDSLDKKNIKNDLTNLISGIPLVQIKQTDTVLDY